MNNPFDNIIPVPEQTTREKKFKNPFDDIIPTPKSSPGTRTAADLINEAYPGTEAKEADIPGIGTVPQPTRREVGEGIRPYAKGAGMVAGSVAGGAAGGLAGAAASVPEAGVTSPLLVPAGAFMGRTIGAGFGTDVGDWLADLISGREHKWGDSAESIKEGMAANIYGEGAGTILSGITGGAAKAYRGIKNAFTTEGAELRAGEKLTNAFGQPTEQELANAAKTEALEKRLGVEPLTPAQRTGSTKAGMVEQSLGATDKDFADTMMKREAEMRERAQGRFLGTMGKGEQLPTTTPPSVTGEAIHAGIEKDLAPVKTAEKAIWGEVPQYPIPSTNLDMAITEINKTPFEKPVKDAVNTTIKYIKQMPRTTEGIRSIEKTLAGNITKALRTGDNNLARIYRNMKTALQADYEAMGTAAEKGDIALYKGEVVYPSDIQARINNISKRIEAETAKESMPDRDAIERVLKGKGVPFIRGRGESAEGHLARITKDYQTHVGGRVPTVPSLDAEAINKLTADKAALQGVLSNLEPAEDVAKAISTAKTFSKEQKFDRFYRGQTKKVLQAGDEFEGQRMPFEQMPKKFYTPSGYKDLVRASGGNAKAAERMRPFVVDDLINSSMSGTEFSVPKALNYLRKNQEVLRTSGLDADVKKIIKGQMPNEFERMLSTKRLDKVTGEPTFTPQEARNLLSKYGKTLRELYGPQSVQALRDYHDLLYALQRNKNISMAGGLTTIEKAMNSPNTPPFVQRVMAHITDYIATGLGAYVGTHLPGGPVVGAMGGLAASATVNEVRAMAVKKTNDILKKALIDPELAEKLMKMMKIKAPDSLAQQAAELIKPYLGPSGITATTEEKPEPQPAPIPRKTIGKSEDE